MDIQLPKLTSTPIRYFRIAWQDSMGQEHHVDIEHRGECEALEWFVKNVQEDYLWISPND